MRPIYLAGPVTKSTLAAVLIEKQQNPDVVIAGIFEFDETKVLLVWYVIDGTVPPMP